jgi:formylglycine-generating enzyme required for sulfatase activity
MLKNLIIIIAGIGIGFVLMSFSAKRDKNNYSAKDIEKDFKCLSCLSLEVSDHAKYVSQYEVTNQDYRRFLKSLKENNQDLYSQCIYDSTKWSTYYSKSFLLPLQDHYHSHPAYNRYPIVNITTDAAKAYCNWLTEYYNKLEGRKFQEVKFRLPNNWEWIKACRPLINSQLPWYGFNPCNEEGKYRANLKYKDWVSDEYFVEYTIDNALTTTMVGMSDLNTNGLYDIIGNVAEMLDSNMQAKGGSWNSFMEDCYVSKTQTYEEANPELGFRVFMEVIQE